VFTSARQEFDCQTPWNDFINPLDGRTLAVAVYSVGKANNGISSGNFRGLSGDKKLNRNKTRASVFIRVVLLGLP
jgi:hypothetical protein